jgi:hypothetical protein
MALGSELNSVNYRGRDYLRQAEHWYLLESLCGGTLEMRRRSLGAYQADLNAYRPNPLLPRQPKEKTADYAARVHQSFLFGGYKDTLDTLSGKPFAESISLQGENLLPAEIQDFVEDPENSGRALVDFARDSFRSALKYGLVHILVNRPQRPERASRSARMAMRPYASIVSAPQLIGWRSERRGASLVMTEARIYEEDVVPAGRFGEEAVERIQVWTEATWEVWEKRGDSQDDFSQVAEGEHSYGGVPLYTIYFSWSGLMQADPPLEDLAWLNLAHWQSYSDQRHILHHARVPQKVFTGLREDEAKEVGGIQEVAASRAIILPDPNSKAFYLEHSGQAIAAGREDLRDIEERMQMMGLAPLVQRSGGITATATAIEESRAHSDVRAWINVFQRALRELTAIAGRWIEYELPALKDFSFDISPNFSVSARVAEDIKTLIEMRRARDISQETFWAEVKRRGVLAEGFEAGTERERIEKEDEPLGFSGEDPDQLREEIERELAEEREAEEKNVPVAVGGN